jgi:hypothetical protein
MDYAIQVFQYISRGDAHHFEPFLFQELVPSLITLRLIAQAVLVAINLDYQAMAKAGEVGGHSINRKLLAELEAVRPRLQRLPQQHFRQTHPPSQLTCALHLLDRCLKEAWAPSTALCAVPLPVPGRIV